MRLPNKFMIWGSYKYNDLQWNASEYVLVKNYDDGLGEAITLITCNLIKRFKMNLNG